ncbi:unannotated protein [freshwater metagenome]|uniref:Unannotated protein n=1 Tax=freshwater metagenome TaxID=449393 RepID=A0A6J7VQE6_9ZZZZ
MRGIVALISISSRIFLGASSQAPSNAAFSQIEDSLTPYSRNGENSLQPLGPSNIAISRVLSSRKIIFKGKSTTCIAYGNIIKVV